MTRSGGDARYTTAQPIKATAKPVVSMIASCALVTLAMASSRSPARRTQRANRARPARRVGSQLGMLAANRACRSLMSASRSALQVRAVPAGPPPAFGASRASYRLTDGAPLLLTKCALHLNQSLLARGYVTISVGCARPRHTLLDCLNGLGPYFAHPFLHSDYGAWSRLRTVRSLHGVGGSRRSGGSYRFELGVDLCLHHAYLVQAWPCVTRRHGCSQHSRAYISPNSHDFASE